MLSNILSITLISHPNRCYQTQVTTLKKIINIVEFNQVIIKHIKLHNNLTIEHKLNVNPHFFAKNSTCFKRQTRSDEY